MKRKILVILLAIACSFCFTFGVAACKDTEGGNQNDTEQGGTNTPDDTNPGGDDTNPGGDDTNPGGDDTNPGGDNTNPGGDNTNPPEIEYVAGTEGLEYISFEDLIEDPEDFNVLIEELGFNEEDFKSYVCVGIGTATDTAITIASHYNSLPVIAIGYGAFEDCTSLKSITIPDSVKFIGGEAFSGCTSLTSVTIGTSVTSIGSSAFYKCTSLESVTIPDGVDTIGGFAFSDCTSLTSITIPNSVIYIGEGSFDNTAYFNNESNWEHDVLYIGKHLIVAREDISGNYSIKSGTRTIAGGAFHGCTSLTSITIPDSVTSIGDLAFGYCKSIVSITIPNSVTSIGGNAFQNCANLASITIPDSVTYIGVSAFYKCTSLKSVIFENTEGWWGAANYETIDISSSDLANPATAAKYLTDVYYCRYHWHRS